MITFETQEEFENAVMDVLKKRLCITVNSFGESSVTVRLTDRHKDIVTSDEG